MDQPMLNEYDQWHLFQTPLLSHSHLSIEISYSHTLASNLSSGGMGMEQYDLWYVIRIHNMLLWYYILCYCILFYIYTYSQLQLQLGWTTLHRHSLSPLRRSWVEVTQARHQLPPLEIWFSKDDCKVAKGMRCQNKQNKQLGLCIFFSVNPCIPCPCLSSDQRHLIEGTDLPQHLAYQQASSAHSSGLDASLRYC